MHLGKRMRQKGKIVAGILLLASVAVCVGILWKRQESEKKNSISIQAMNTLMTLTAYGTDTEEGLTAAADRIKTIEAVFSVTEEDSEVYKINHRTEDKVVVSEELMSILGQAVELGKRGDGTFDITMYPVTRLWGFTEEVHQVPETAEIEAALRKIGYSRLQLDTLECTLALEAGMEIDFGAMAKGYAADEAIEVLKEQGVKSAIVSLGGNIQTLGTKPDGSNWNVAIKNPRYPEQYLGAVEVGEKAVVTSGGYERYFEDEEGNIWWHIMDPSTGYPAKNGLLSVTIISDSGLLSDALSTMLFVKGLEGAVKDWQEHGDYEAVFVTEDGEIYATEGIYDSFTPVDKNSIINKISKGAY